MLSNGMCSQTLPTAHVSMVHAKPSLHCALVAHDVADVNASTPTSMGRRDESGSSLCRVHAGLATRLAARTSATALGRTMHEDERMSRS
jgi:hypothetical protein